MTKMILGLTILIFTSCLNTSVDNQDKLKNDMNIFSTFNTRFNKNSKINIPTQEQIDRIEKGYNISLPEDYKMFVKTFGDVWTPDILDIIVDSEINMNDIQQFWTVEEIIYDKKNEWTSKLSTDLIPFASDSMGNIFAFKSDELKGKKLKVAIYFFDHDFDTIEMVADSFTDLINNYNGI